MSLALAPNFAKPAGLRKGASFYPELESLRGVAIFLVVAFHGYSAFFGALKAPISPELSLALIQGGHTGVTLFFVLSAFLLGMPFIKASIQNTGRPNAKNFFKRRFLRIAPLYVVAVLVATVATKDVETGARALVFWAKGVEMYPYSAVWWSLQVEVQFYLLLPLIGAALWYPAGRKILASLVAVYLGFYLVVYVLLDLKSHIQGHSLFGRGPIFLIGLATAYFYLRYDGEIRAKTARSRFWKNGGSDLLLLTAIVILSVLLNKITGVGYLYAEKHYQYWHIAEGLLWAAVLLVLLLFPLRLKRIVHNAYLSLLGIWSYSLYLNHYPILFFGIIYAPSLFPSTAHVDSLERIGFSIALGFMATVFAGITYLVIEKRFLTKKEHLA